MPLDSNGITIHPATRDDHRALLAFLIEQYPQLGWSEPYMEWQYYRNPAGVAKSWVAKHEGKLIANYTAIPHALSVDGKIQPSWRVQDVITHPEYRGMGLYARVSDEATRFLQNGTFPLNFTFPNENSHPGFMKRNWFAAQRIPLWTGSPSGRISTQLDAEPISAFQEQDAEVWKAYKTGVRYGVERSAAYLNWKYFQNPRGGYSAFRLTSVGARAVCVLKLFDKGAGEKFAHLCDLFYEPGFSAISEAVAFFKVFAQDRGATACSAWSPPQSALAAQLHEFGFQLQTALARWFVLNHSPALQHSEVENFANWHLSMGDSDVY